MKLQKGNWYVCLKNWSDDGWTKFYEGMLLLCERDNELTDSYGISHLFIDDELKMYFRKATDVESNIAQATEIDMDEFMEDNVFYFEPYDKLIDIYRKGAEAMIERIRANLTTKN